MVDTSGQAESHDGRREGVVASKTIQVDVRIEQPCQMNSGACKKRTRLDRIPTGKERLNETEKTDESQSIADAVVGEVIASARVDGLSNESDDEGVGNHVTASEKSVKHKAKRVAAKRGASACDHHETEANRNSGAGAKRKNCSVDKEEYVVQKQRPGRKKVVTQKQKAAEEFSEKSAPHPPGKKVTSKVEDVPHVDRLQTLVEAAEKVVVESCTEKRRRKGKGASVDAQPTVKKQKRARKATQFVSFVNKDGIKYDKEIRMSCHPGLLVDVVRKLTDPQKADVEAIGFGGLLKLHIRKYPLGIVPYLVSKFDHKYGVQHIGSCQYEITVDDVYDVLGLPIGGKDVPIESLAGNGAKIGVETRAGWRSKFKVDEEKGDIPLDALVKAMEELPNGGEDFVRYFVLFCASSFLSPTITRNVDMQLLKAVENVSEIRGLNWSKYVLEKLLRGVKRYYTTDYTALSGCVYLLLIQFLQRVPYLGIPDPLEVPLLQHWTEDRLNKRYEWLRECGYDDAPLQVGVYPLTRGGKLLKHAKFDKEVASDDAKIVGAAEEITTLGLNAADEAFELFRRDMGSCASKLFERLAKAESNANEAPVENASQKVWGFQEFRSDPSLHKLFDQICSHTKRKVASVKPSFD